jgi:hypothetical protein
MNRHPKTTNNPLSSKIKTAEEFEKYIKEIEGVKSEKGFNTCLNAAQNLDLCLKIFSDRKLEKCVDYLESTLICLKNKGKYFE